MLNPSKFVCPAVTAILVIGAFFWVQGAERLGVRPSSPVLMAMQDARSAASEPASHARLSNVGWIGVMLEDHEGVRVKGVFPAGPAAFAGARVGDVLLKIDGKNVDSTNAAEAAIEGLAPGRAAALTVRRHGKTVELKVTPGSLAEFRKHYIGEMLRRDPRDPKYGQHHGVSDADLQVEVVRRLFEQHHRMEATLLQLTTEIQALRKEVRALQK